MTKLSDLIKIGINQDTIAIQGVKIPVIFTFSSFPYIEEAYGKEYHEFEHELNEMMLNGSLRLGKKETKLMHALIYGMVRAGGTECTPHELETSIPFPDLVPIFQTVLHIFNNQHFQDEDFAKIKSDEKK